jgi:hypothetical protein
MAKWVVTASFCVFLPDPPLMSSFGYINSVILKAKIFKIIQWQYFLSGDINTVAYVSASLIRCLLFVTFAKKNGPTYSMLDWDGGGIY